MSVIIKDMEVPQYCGACHVGFCKQIGCELYIGFDDYATSRHPDCPISNIPTPHGRLIDASEAYDKIAESAGEGSGNYVDMDVVGRGLDDTPTIIEAEEGA